MAFALLGRGARLLFPRAEMGSHMLIGRWIGRIFLAAALIVLGTDLRPWLDGQAFELAPLGGIWYKLDAASLNLFQAGITRHIDDPYFGGPTIYPVVQTIETFPAVYVLGVLALIFLYLFRRRRPRPY
jgi:hypothetical protein